MTKVLIVVDMQNDFVDGALGSAEAVAIVPAVEARVRAAHEAGETILFTRDTHPADYLSTQEGKNLPVEHCIKGSPGWEIIPALAPYTRKHPVLNKPTFGSVELGQALSSLVKGGGIESITLIGLCTDICVISNALLLKAFLPEVPILVDAACCAGVSPESHRNALSAMAACQIRIENAD